MTWHIARKVLEVRSDEGRVLEGVFELAERAAADLYVNDLSGEGVRCKVLEVPCVGIATRPENIEKAWTETPFPSKWYVLLQEGQDIALAVYGEALRHEAIAQRRKIQDETGQHIHIYPFVHPERPRVGRSYLKTQAPDAEMRGAEEPSS